MSLLCCNAMCLACRSWVTSQIFNLECYTIDHHGISYFIAFWLDPRNSTQLKDPRRELGISLFSYLSFSQILKRGSFDFNYFIFKYFFYKNKRERIKWLPQKKIGDLILKSNKIFIRSFIAILFELGKNAFFKIAY